MQVVCGSAPGALEAALIVMHRPCGARDGPHPSRCIRSSENRNRCATVHPVFSSIASALNRKLEAALTAVNAAIAADMDSACLAKRRTHCCPRWYDPPGAATFQTWLSIKRAFTVLAISGMLKRINGNAHSGNSDTVRKQP